MIFQENVLVFPGHYEVYYYEDFHYVKILINPFMTEAVII